MVADDQNAKGNKDDEMAALSPNKDTNQPKIQTQWLPLNRQAHN
jgi:hypothetical protein